MKKMSDIMDELGFRPEASDDVKKAFIKNLIRQANASEIKQEKKKDKRDPDQYVQISLFDQKLSS